MFLIFDPVLNDPRGHNERAIGVHKEEEKGGSRPGIPDRGFCLEERKTGRESWLWPTF